MTLCRFLLIACVAASSAGAATWQEDFADAPDSRGWATHGDAALFHWNATNQNLEVTWDSSRPNSYFLRPLGTIVAKDDDFSFEFDLLLSDVAVGVNSNKPYTFEIALGFVRLASATDTNLQRGSGINAVHGARHLAEFDYFPDSGFGATVSPTVVSGNNQFATTFNYPLEMDPGALFHVAMSYTASNKTLRTTMTRNGAGFGPIQSVILGASFTDFRLDHFAICSYSDEGADGSLLARGTVDNISVTVPPPPVTEFTGALTNGIWQTTFLTRSNWLYTLERTADFSGWTDISPAMPGTGNLLSLQDTNPPPDNALYRIRAERP